MAACALVAAPVANAAQIIRMAPTQARVVGEKADAGAAPYATWKAAWTSMGGGGLNINSLKVQAASGATIPFWTSTITSPLNNTSYTTSMVGSDPALGTSTAVTYVPIVVRVHFSNGTVLDPSTAKSQCTAAGAADTATVSSRFFSSPLFYPTTLTSNGVTVSGANGSQLIGGFQRANFWSTVSGTGYDVVLNPSLATPKVVDITAPRTAKLSTLSVKCGSLTKSIVIGQIDINSFDKLVQTVVAQNSGPSQLPVLLTYNVVQTQNGQCCILGYHNAVAVSTGTQTYAVGAYVDSGIFSGVDDIVIWSHELGEWMDDPFVQAAVTGGGAADTTPAWGHVGQVSSCQTNLEVGDPLSGTEFALATSAFNYHFQDMAFADWFYRTASRGSKGLYSFQGVFTSTQALCH